MSTRLWLVCHAATPAMRAARFPDDDALDARGVADAAAWWPQQAIAADALTLASPSVAAIETARAFGLTPQVTSALADADYGEWRGRKLAEFPEASLGALLAWTSDPTVAPPGGESFAQVRERVGQWLDGVDAAGDVVAVTHACVIRAAVVHVLDAPSSSLSRLEVAPLTVVELRHSTRGWQWWPAQR